MESASVDEEEEERRDVVWSCRSGRSVRSSSGDMWMMLVGEDEMEEVWVAGVKSGRISSY